MIVCRRALLAVAVAVVASGQAIRTAEQAVARANKLTGLAAKSQGPASAVSGKAIADVTPFLGKGNAGKAVWMVSYPGAVAASPEPLTLVATLEAATGRLLYVMSLGTLPANARPMPGFDLSTAQLKAEGESYSGYPARDPRVALASAMELKGARQVHAVYVMHRKGVGAAKAVWAITLNGIEPAPPGRGRGADQIPEWQRNHMRYVVDAETGKLLFSTNTPQPE